MIYGEVEGLTYLAGFGLFAEAFDEPDRVRRRPHREVVRGYLRDRSVSPLPFRRLAAADPAKASRVFQLLLRRPGFSWESRRRGAATAAQSGLLRHSAAAPFHTRHQDRSRTLPDDVVPSSVRRNAGLHVDRSLRYRTRSRTVSCQGVN
jgi:hypothetical protein